jgi:hypothetical protein
MEIKFQALDPLIDEIINDGNENDMGVVTDVIHDLGFYAGAVFKHRFEYRTGINISMPEDMNAIIHFN